jgi:signal transduction histidine kinase
MVEWGRRYMHHSVQPDHLGHELAVALEIQRDSVVAKFLTDLRTTENGIVADPDAMEQTARNAKSVITDVAEALCGESFGSDGESQALAEDIGIRRATQGIHPVESIKACALLFQAVMEAIDRGVNEIVPSDPNSATALVTAAAVAAHRSISRRTWMAAVAYTGFLLTRVRQAQDEERQRIARELHDRVGHGVAIAHQLLQLSALYRANSPERADRKVLEAQATVQATIVDIRRVIADLTGDERIDNLETALREYLRTAAPERTETEVVVNGDEAWALIGVREQLLLVLREAAHNAILHSTCSLLRIEVNVAPHEIHAIVEDNGVGYEPGQAAAGIGLRSMRERVTMLNGTVRYDTRIDCGTRVEVIVPLHGDRSRIDDHKDPRPPR